MAKYSTKPVIVDAEVYAPGMEDGFDFYAIGGKFICSLTKEEMLTQGQPRSNREPFINTSKGKYRVSPGDYVVTEATGGRHVYKPDIFAATYEKIETEDEQPLAKYGIRFTIPLSTKPNESYEKAVADEKLEDQYPCTDKECYERDNFRRTCVDCPCYKSA